MKEKESKLQDSQIEIRNKKAKYSKDGFHFDLNQYMKTKMHKIE